MIDSDGWLDWAAKLPGPLNKTYAEPNLNLGIVFHSMEGWLTGSLIELQNPDRQASWTFSLGLDGTLYQHYPVTSSCWASGNKVANVNWWSLELEGVANMPINSTQIATALKLIREWELYSGYVAIRTGDRNTQSMHQHREVATMATPNSGPTACPSLRYEPLWEILAEGENGMTNEELNKIVQDLNEAMVKRCAIWEIGAGPYERMLRAYDVLKAAGLL